MPIAHKPSFVFVTPPDNAVVHPNTPFEVSGRVTDDGSPEPHFVDLVTVQVDSSPAVKAALHRIHDQTQSLVAFSAFVSVTGGQDPHTLTVTAKDDRGATVTVTRKIFTVVAFAVDAPAVVIDVLSFVPFNEPVVLGQTASLQKALKKLATSLADIGKVLAGPNFQFTEREDGKTSRVRIGLWIEDPSFPVIPPGGGRTLPIVPDPGAQGGFALVPPIPVPASVAAFAVFTKPGLLQQLVDAVAPGIKEAASGQGVSIDSLNVQTVSPATVTTHLTGSLPALVPFDMTITETIGVAKASNQITHVPAVIKNSHSSGLGNILDVLIAVVLSPFRYVLAAEFLALRSKTGDTDNRITGMMQDLLEGVPIRYPFSKSFFQESSSIEEFPVVVLDWKTFGVMGTSIAGSGLMTINHRLQADVALALSGPTVISGFQGEMDLVLTQTFTFTLTDLAPDTDKFRWTITGPQSSSGSIDSSTFGQSGDFIPLFPVPRNVKVGNWAYTLSVTAIETSSDKKQTLTASASLKVVIEVKPNPRH